MRRLDLEHARNPRRTFALATLIASLALLFGIVSAWLAGGASKASQTAASAISGSSTATVQRRDLVQTDSETGTIGHTDTRDVYNHLSGTVTWLPRAGSVIKADQALYRVDGEGVYLLDGSIPAYRSFSSGMSNGADVAELNRDLRALGYDPSNEIGSTNPRHYGQGTLDAIERWQKAHGLSQTGTIDLGRVVFLPGRRRIETVDLGIGGPASSSSSSTGQSSTGQSSTATGASYAGSTPQTSSAVYHPARSAKPEFVSLTTGSGNPAASTTQSTTSTTTTSPPPTTTIRSPSTTVITKCTTITSGAATTTTTTTTRAPKKKKTANKGKPAKTKCPSSPSSTQPTTSTPSSAAGSATSGAGGAATASTPSSSGTTSAGSSGATSGATGGTSSAASTQASGNIALVTTSRDTVVTVPLDTSKQTEAVVGEPVQVTLPSTRVVNGRITSVASVAVASTSSSSSSSSTSGSSSSTSSTVSVDIALDKRATRSKDAQLDQAPVTVAFAQQEQRGALSIPVTALVATAGGGYAVDEVTGTGRNLVAVTPGLYAGGYVSISGNISQGATVTNGSQ